MQKRQAMSNYCEITVNITDNFNTSGQAFPLTHPVHSDASNQAPATVDS